MILRMPADLIAEQAVLGAPMISPSTAAYVTSALTAADFFLPAHQRIFEAYAALVAAGTPVDLITVSDRLRASGALRLLEGGEGYLVAMATTTPAISSVEHYAAIVRNKALLRRVIVACSNAADSAYLPDASADEVLAQVRTELAQAEAESVGLSAGPRSLTESIDAAVGEIFDRSERKRETSVPLGVAALDEKIGGGRAGRLIVIAARPGVGKTALAVGSLYRAAQRGIPALLFSLEMSRQEIIERLLARDLRINGEIIDRGKLDYMACKKIQGGAGRVGKLPMWIDDRSLTAGQIIAAARLWRAQNPSALAVIAVDYLGLMRSAGRHENRTNEVGFNCRAMKTLAKDVACPVVLVAQLNRASEKEGREPMLSDLRDSGEIEQHAHTVIFPHRDMGLHGSGPGHLIAAKNRGGVTGRVECWWNAELMAWEDNREHEEATEVPRWWGEKKEEGVIP